MHTRLLRSDPPKDSVVRTAPTALRLWFSERLDVAVTRVSVTDGAQQAVPVGALAYAAGDDAPMVVPLAQPLPDGAYTVRWSTSSRDGHPVRGTYRFRVRTAP
jgi:methionine-rich copper-binding protein CopC